MGILTLGHDAHDSLEVDAKRWLVLLFGIQHRVQSRVVVHLHLLIHFHILTPGFDVSQQSVDGCRKVGTLFQQDVELGAALFTMLFGGVGAIHFLLHMVDFQGQNGESVYGPSRAFGIDAGIGQSHHLFVLVEEIAVDKLHQVGAVLVGLVDATFQYQGFGWIYLWVANDVFKMPLHGIDPVLQVEIVFDGLEFVGVVHRGIHTVGDVVVEHRAIENLVAERAKCHHNVRF